MLDNNNNLSLEEKEVFNKFMREALLEMTSPMPDYSKIKNKLVVAFSYFPESEDIKNLIKECDEKIGYHLKYNNMLRESLKQSKKEGINDKAISYYIQSIQIDPLHELNKQYDKMMVMSIESEQISSKYDAKLNNIINRALHKEKAGEPKEAYELWSKAFKIKKQYSFFRKILHSLILLDMPIKAGNLVIHLIDNYYDCFKQIEINEKKIQWICDSIKKILTNCKFVQSHIDSIKKERKKLTLKNSGNDVNLNVLRKEKDIKVGQEKLTEIINTLTVFLKDQFYLD